MAAAQSAAPAAAAAAAADAGGLGAGLTPSSHGLWSRLRSHAQGLMAEGVQMQARMQLLDAVVAGDTAQLRALVAAHRDVAAAQASPRQPENDEWRKKSGMVVFFLHERLQRGQSAACEAVGGATVG